MNLAISRSKAALLRRLIPVLLDDEHFFAVAKPARLDLEAPIHKRGPAAIAVLAAASAGGTGDALLPLLVPERFASGVALFARNGEAARRFAGLAATGKLEFVHAAVVRGKVARARIAVKPNPHRPKGGKPSSRAPATAVPHAPAAAVPRAPAAVVPRAQVEIVQSLGEHHVARCRTAVAGLEDFRRCFKAAGLVIVGDDRPTPHSLERRPRPARRPLVHLEELSFPHPFAKQMVSIQAAAPRAYLGYLASKSVAEEHWRSALALRLECLLAERTDSFRLFAGRNEGISGFVADKLGPVVVLETLQGKFQGDEAQLRQAANFYARVLDAKTVYARNVPIHRDSRPVSRQGSTPVTLLKGEPVDELTIVENGVKYIVQPAAGLALGLYLDQRDNRRRIMSLSAGKEVLNLFAYTCGFSVAAACAGAASTTSVDLSAASLEWGKRNFVANGFDPGRHIFVKTDAFDYLKRALRQEKRFDIVVLDPPSFSRAKKPKRTFELKKDLGGLIAAALGVLTPGGHLLVSTNYRQVSAKWLAEQVDRAAGGCGYQIVARPQLPVDFAADPDHQKSILVRFN